MASAHVTVLSLTDGREVLQSYGTTVAARIPGLGLVRTDRKFSVTTSRHIKQWLCGVKALSIPHAQLLELTAPIESSK